MADQHSLEERRRKQMEGHGVFHMLEVERILKQAGIICCIAGIKALSYYGVRATTPDWEVCVPDDRFSEAVELFQSLDDSYKAAPGIMPQLASLLHTWPHFQPIQSNEGINMTFWIMPAFEWFPGGLEESMIERSRSNLPFPRVEYFAQSLITTQRFHHLLQLVDGMDLSEQWGYDNLRLGEPSESDVTYARTKNQQYYQSLKDRPRDFIADLIDVGTFDRTKRWQRMVRTKEERIDDYGGAKQRYSTRFRRKGSGDPRLRERLVL